MKLTFEGEKIHNKPTNTYISYSDKHQEKTQNRVRWKGNMEWGF